MMQAINYFPYRRQFIKLLFGLLALLFFIFIGGLVLGTLTLSPNKLTHFVSLTGEEVNFVFQLRFYRAIAAICGGGMLAVGSAMLQGLTRNPMVAPDLTGMTSLGCLLIIMCEMYCVKSPIVNEALGIFGASLGFLLCYALVKNVTHRVTIVLVGLILSFTATAFTQLLLLTAPRNMDDYLHFLTGSLYAIRGETVFILLSMTLIALPLALLASKRFILFSLDESSCHSLGIAMRRYRKICFMIAALLIGSSIIGIGNMGFLGIVAPNIARLFVGNRPQYVFPLSFLLGASLYLLADILGRCLISPAEIPAGIMTNMLSAPLFLFILFRYYRGQYDGN